MTRTLDYKMDPFKCKRNLRHCNIRTVLLSPSLSWRTLNCVLLLMVAWCVDVSVCQAPAEPIEYHINEELPPFTMVGNVIKNAGLDKIYNQSVLQEMEFSLASQRNDNWNLFAIDDAGILRTTETIDRDKICAQEDICAVNLRIIIQPIKYFRVIKVTVHIEDRNDNPPTFPRETIQLSVVETASSGTVFALPGAEDLDSGSNGVQSYQLNPADGIFHLEVEDTPDGGVALSLLLQGVLDREQEETYTMWVTAVDGGQPERTGSMLVQVRVTDANDNNPRFDNDTYTVMVPENIPLRTTILQVRATDKDIGVNGQVIYALSEASQQAYGSVFGINPESGELFIKGEIDYEGDAEGVYQLTIVARDQGANSLPAYAKVFINVEDLNDHAPVIKLNTLTPSGNAQISEGSKTGIFVAHIQVEDPDGGEIKCNMDNDYFALQEIYNSEYKIVTKAVFDREVKSEYHINLVCHDRGQPPLTSTKHIVVTVTDENDHPPVFSQETYFSTIAENNAVGAYIIQVTTTDMDLGRNAAVIYQVENDPKEALSIDRVSGIIKANRPFDREEQQEYEFFIVAVDQGSPKNSATATLTVTILDENDNPPVFEKSEYMFSLLEHQKPVQMDIGGVMATDADLPPYGSCVYTLLDSNTNLTSPDVFSIDPKSGVISTNVEIDREAGEEYNLIVLALNEGFPSLNATVNVTVRILDLNDHAPVVRFNFFNSTSAGERTIQVSNKLPREHVIGIIDATDSDSGSNADLSYKLTNVSDDLFRLDVWTGEIIVNVDLKRFMNHMTHMVFEVSDKGSPALTTVTNLTIIVNQSVLFVPPLPVQSFWTGMNIFAVCIGATFFVILLLICIAVFIVKKRQTCKDKKHTYNCRLEAEKTETSIASKGGSPSSEDKGKHNLCFEGDLREPEKVTVQGVELGESCTDDNWPKAKDNPYILDTKPVIEKEKRRSAGKKCHVDVNQQEVGNQRHLVPPQQHPPAYSRMSSESTPLKEMELQVQDMLHILLREKESPSETGSYTDSGKGPSEEGDHSHSWPECQMDNAKGMSPVAEAHSLALSDTRRHSSNNYDETQGGDTNTRYIPVDEGIYVTAIPREEVYAEDPQRRAYDARLYALDSYPSLSSAPSYTPPPSYQDSMAANAKRVGRFASYTPRSSGKENNFSLPRTLSDAGSRLDSGSRSSYRSHDDNQEAAGGARRREEEEEEEDCPPGKLSKWGNRSSLLEDETNTYDCFPFQQQRRESAEYSDYNQRLGKKSNFKTKPCTPANEDSMEYQSYQSMDRGGRDLGASWGPESGKKSRTRLHRTQAERIADSSGSTSASKPRKPRVQFWDEGPVDKCVHDIVARYIPDKSETINNPDSVDGFSDDDVTTESGSYVIDPEMYLRNKDQKETYVDYIIV